MTQNKLPRSIFIDVAQWYDKVNGNTYFSAVVSVDGKWLYTTGMEYGYGNHAEDVVMTELAANGIIPAKAYGAWTMQMREIGIDYYVSYRDVLKRDLRKKDYSEFYRTVHAND